MFKTPRQNTLEKQSSLMKERENLDETNYKKNQLDEKIYKINNKLGLNVFWNSKIKGTYKKAPSEVKNG